MEVDVGRVLQCDRSQKIQSETPGTKLSTNGELLIGWTRYRHFADDDALRAYLELVTEFERWVTARPEVAALVHVVPFEEVGTDFYARQHLAGEAIKLSSFDSWLVLDPSIAQDHLESWMALSS